MTSFVFQTKHAENANILRDMARLENFDLENKILTITYHDIDGKKRDVLKNHMAKHEQYIVMEQENSSIVLFVSPQVMTPESRDVIQIRYFIFASDIR